MKVNNSVNKGFVIAVLVFSLQGLAQSSESGQPTEKSLELLHEITIDLNRIPKISSPPTTPYCGPYTVQSTFWNVNSTRLAVGIGSGDGSRNCPISGAVQIFDMTTKSPELLFTLTDSTSLVRSVVYNPDSTQLAVGSNDKMVRIYDGGNPVSPLYILTDATDSVRSIAYNPDGTRLAVGGDDNKVRVYDGVIPVSPLHILTDAKKYVRSVVYSPDGTRLAVGGDDDIIRVYDGGNPDFPLHRLNTLADMKGIGLSVNWKWSEIVWSLAYNSDGTRLAAAGKGVVWIYDGINPVSPLRTLNHDVYSIRSIAYSPDGSRLVTGSDDAKVRIFDEDTSLRHALVGAIARMWSIVRNELAAWRGDIRGRIYYGDSETSPQQTLTDATGRVTSVSYNHDGSQLTVGGMDGKVRIYSDRNSASSRAK